MSSSRALSRFSAEAIRSMKPVKNPATGNWRAPPLSKRRQKLALQRITLDKVGGNGNSVAAVSRETFAAPDLPQNGLLHALDDTSLRPAKGRLFERRAEARFKRIESALKAVPAEVEKHRRQIILEKWKLKKLDKGSQLLKPVKRPAAVRSELLDTQLDPLPAEQLALFQRDPKNAVKGMKLAKQKRVERRSKK